MILIFLLPYASGSAEFLGPQDPRNYLPKKPELVNVEALSGHGLNVRTPPAPNKRSNSFYRTTLTVGAESFTPISTSHATDLSYLYDETEDEVRSYLRTHQIPPSQPEACVAVLREVLDVKALCSKASHPDLYPLVDPCNPYTDMCCFDSNYRYSYYTPLLGGSKCSSLPTVDWDIYKFDVCLEDVYSSFMLVRNEDDGLIERIEWKNGACEGIPDNIHALKYGCRSGNRLSCLSQAKLDKIAQIPAPRGFYFSSCRNATNTVNPFKDAIQISGSIFKTNVSLSEYLQYGTTAQLKCGDKYTVTLEQWPPKLLKRKTTINRDLISYCTEGDSLFLWGYVPPNPLYQEYCAGDDFNSGPNYLDTYGVLPLWPMNYSTCESECRNLGLVIPCGDPFDSTAAVRLNVSKVGAERFADLVDLAGMDLYYHFAFNHTGFPDAEYCPPSTLPDSVNSPAYLVGRDTWTSYYYGNSYVSTLCVCSRLPPIISA